MTSRLCTLLLDLTDAHCGGSCYRPTLLISLAVLWLVHGWPWPVCFQHARLRETVGHIFDATALRHRLAVGSENEMGGRHTHPLRRPHAGVPSKAMIVHTCAFIGKPSDSTKLIDRTTSFRLAE